MLRRFGALVCAHFVVVYSQIAFAANEQLTPPTVLERVEPVYPAGARARGVVVVSATVGADGVVSEAQVMTALDPLLDAAALATARRWRFSPARLGAQPVATRVTLELAFAPPPPAEAPALEVRVVGRRPPPARGTADYQLEPGALAQVPRARAAQLLELAPGILLTNDGGEGHAEQVFLRGFDAREGQDIAFSVGGVPINESGNPHGNGYADTHFLIPELVQGLRVLEGPFDPRQGNYAVAGSADYQLGLPERGLATQLSVGSFGTRRALVLWGPEGEGAATFGGAELYQSDGFGANRDSRRGSVMGQYQGRVGERSTFRLTGQGYATSYHSAGVVRDDDVRAGRVAFYGTSDPNQGGDASRFSLAADVDSGTFTQGLWLVVSGMRLREDFTGFLLDAQKAIQAPHLQRGDLLDLDTQAVSFGARGSASVRPPGAELELGYFARGDLVSGEQQRLAAATGHPYATVSRLDSRLADLGLYADLAVRPRPWLSLRGGLRADLFTFDVDDRCAAQDVAHPSRSDPPGDASCLEQENMGAHREANQRASTAGTAFLPRGTLLVGPFRGLTASASYGRGARSIDPAYVTGDVPTPFAQVSAVEAGVSWQRSGENVAVAARSALFQTRVDRDLIFSETAGRNVLGGSTTRTGWLATARLTGPHFDQSLNVTWVRSTFDDTHLLVPYLPDLVVRSDGALFGELPRLPLRGHVALGVSCVGRRPLPYGQRSDAVFTADLGAGVGWRWLELEASATNLLDRRYRLGEYNFVSNFQQSGPPTLVPERHFSAGPPRALLFTLRVRARR